MAFSIKDVFLLEREPRFGYINLLRIFCRFQTQLSTACDVSGLCATLCVDVPPRRLSRTT